MNTRSGLPSSLDESFLPSKAPSLPILSTSRRTTFGLALQQIVDVHRPPSSFLFPPFVRGVRAVIGDLVLRMAAIEIMLQK